MKILILSHRFFPDIGGIETVSEMLADEFVKQGQEVRILTWSGKGNTTEVHFPYQVLRQPGLMQIVQSIRWADVVFENNPCLRLSWPNLLLRKPLVVALHTWIRSVDQKIKLPQQLKFLWLKRADRVIACSDALRKETYPCAVTIGNPYNHLLFRRKGSVWPSKDYVFLGRLVSDKGVSLAIRSFHQLLQQLPNAAKDSTFTIIGDGVERLRLQQQANDLGIEDKIIFCGSMKGEALVQVLNEHRYIIIPSLWHEPFGLVALEGMACGCLPIVSNGGGLPDAVGKGGIPFKSGSAESLTERMIELKRNPALEADLRQAAPAHLKKHEADSVAKQYLQVLLSVVDTTEKPGKV